MVALKDVDNRRFIYDFGMASAFGIFTKHPCYVFFCIEKKKIQFNDQNTFHSFVLFRTVHTQAIHIYVAHLVLVWSQNNKIKKHSGLVVKLFFFCKCCEHKYMNCMEYTDARTNSKRNPKRRPFCVVAGIGPVVVLHCFFLFIRYLVDVVRNLIHLVPSSWGLCYVLLYVLIIALQLV